MNRLFQSDVKHISRKKIVLRSPLCIVVENTELLPCASFFIEEAKKRGFSGIVTNQSVAYYDSVIFSMKLRYAENFYFECKKSSEQTILIFSGSKLSSCYYAIQGFLRDVEIRHDSLSTHVRFYAGETKNFHRNLIISLSWMENLIEFPFFDFERWKRFIDLVSEMRFNRIDFMQWGCTIPSSPPGDIGAEDEWELWQEGVKRKCTWPVPEAYRGLKYREEIWGSRCIFEPWLFPVTGKTIKDAARFSVCYPPETKIPLSRWDIRNQRLVRKFWHPPFIKDRDLFKKITDLIHNRGMRVGIFTTPRVPCILDEQRFEAYWKEVIDFFFRQGVDDFVFETEEGPVSFEHHRECISCQNKYGDIFTGYTKKIARQTEILQQIIKDTNKESRIGWILHVPLHAGYGNPFERKEWLKNPDNYIKNLDIFKKHAAKDFTLDYVPMPGEKGIDHGFLPYIYYEVFGHDRINPAGYTHAWGPARSFLGLEAYFIGIARRLWEYDHSKTMWYRDELEKKEVMAISRALYGSDFVVTKLAKYSINNRRHLYGENSAVCPLTWDRSSFCIAEQLLKKMFLRARKEIQSSYLPLSVNQYKKVLFKAQDALKQLNKVKPSHSFLCCDWDFDEGLQERISLVRSACWIIKFLLLYDSLLVKMASGKKIRERDFKRLIKIGYCINNTTALGHKSSWWPSSSRLGGIYDYYVFARFFFRYRKTIINSSRCSVRKSTINRNSSTGSRSLS